MAEYGTVQKVDGDYVELALTRSEACKHCNACLPSLTDKTMILRAKNECGARTGQFVRVRVTQQGFLSAVVLLYAIPAVLFILSVVIFSALNLNDWFVLGISAVVVAVAWLIIHFISKKLNMNLYMPVAEEIIQKREEIVREQPLKE